LHNILYLLHKPPTRFGHLSWPLSGSYKFGRRVQRIWTKYMAEICRSFV